MTTSPPLFVVPPPSGLELKSSPPTPYTPNSASTSSLHKPTEIPELPLPPEKPVAEMKPVDKGSEPEEPAGVPEVTGESEVANKGNASTEMIIATPTVLLPSPPLTEVEEQEDDKENLPSEQRERTSLRHLAEEDITNWQSSVDGSYHEDDLGYSTNEATPIDGGGGPLGTSMQQGGVSQDRLSVPSARHEPEHPLSLNMQPPSPPPWEIIEPPATNNRHLSPVGESFPETGRNMPKSISSRPLIPHSSYYFGPPPIDSAFGTNPIGHLGVHHPREIIRIERDYSGGELVQFAPIYPLELEGRITPTQFLETINAMNEVLISAHSLKHSLVENVLSFFTLQLSRVIVTSHYQKEMRRLHSVIDDFNRRLYNPVGLNILWPQKVAFMFLEIEYY